jgi:predicted secreted protein
MAKPTTFKGSKLYISLGNGATPEVFTAPCGITSRGLAMTKDVTDVTVPDCDDPDAPSWVERDVSSFSGEVSGSGILAAEAWTTWRTAFLDTDARNARVGIEAPPAQHGGYFAGSMHLTSLNLTGDIGEKISVTITLQSNGELVWVPST